MYRLQFYQHVFTTLKQVPGRAVTFAQYAEAWNAFKDFFELALDESTPSGLILPNNWVYETLSEMAYHYEQFHKARATAGGVEAGAGDEAEEEGASGKQAVEMGDITEAELSKAWNVADVLAYLHNMAEKADIAGLLASGRQPSGFREVAGYFALPTLCRFYTKLGDYAAAIDAVKPLNIFQSDGTLFARTLKAHATLQYYASFSLMMSRRYEEALRVLNRTLSYFQRSHALFGDRDREAGVSSYIRRQGDKMLCMLAVCSAVVPGSFVDENLRRPLRERHAEKTERIAAGNGEDDVAALVGEAAPGYISWAPVVSSAEDKSVFADPKATTMSHLQAIVNDVKQRTSGTSSLRAFLRLYTNIDVPKLASYTGSTPEDVR